MIAAYYLILTMASNGGITQVPMPSKEACIREKIRIDENIRLFSVGPHWAYCVRANSAE